MGSCPFFCLVRSCGSANHVHVFYFPRRDPRLITLKSSSEPPGKPPRPSVSGLSCPDLSRFVHSAPFYAFSLPRVASKVWSIILLFYYNISLQLLTNKYPKGPLVRALASPRRHGKERSVDNTCVGRPHVAKKPVTEPTEELPGLESQTARYHRGGSYVTPDRWFD